MKKGFTLVEILVGTAVFAMVAVAAYGAFAALFRLVNLAQYQELAVDVANEQLEIIRNMPYTDIGVTGSIPNGNVPYQQTLVRGGISFMVTAIIRNIDLPSDGLAGGTPNDTNPADNKLISLSVSCDSCANTSPLTVTGQAAPLALENTGNTGSLFIHVHDAPGKAVQGANVTVTNPNGGSPITINDVTDNNGVLELVGVPPGVNAYHTVVTKAGYSADQTYPPGPGITNPNSNVSTGQVTDAYFFIDRLSSFSITSVSPTCSPVDSFDFNLTSSKQVGTNLPKYSHNWATDGAGNLSLPTLEWDTAGYLLTPLDSTYDLAGVNPSNPIVLNPGTAINLQLIVVPSDPKSVMVSVSDNTGLPIPGVDVRLSGNGYDETVTTGQGSISQSDWSSGSGQSDFAADPAGYSIDDSNIDATTVPGDIMLRSAFGVYNPSGYLESSTFDTGTSSNFYNIVWKPGNQAASTSVAFQFATSPSSTPTGGWLPSQFTGPDGTHGSYYMNANSSLDNASMNGNRYARYMAYLSNATSTVTPDISDVGFTYTSACIPPGQVLFQGLSDGTYDISLTKTGYADKSDTVTVSAGSSWVEKDETMGP